MKLEIIEYLNTYFYLANPDLLFQLSISPSTEVSHILFSKGQSQTDNRPGTLNELSSSPNSKMKLFTTVAAALAASKT